MSLFEGYWKQIIGADITAAEALNVPEGFKLCTPEDPCINCRMGDASSARPKAPHAFQIQPDGGHHIIYPGSTDEPRTEEPDSDPERDFVTRDDEEFDKDEAAYEKQRLRDLDPRPIILPGDKGYRR